MGCLSFLFIRYLVDEHFTLLEAIQLHIPFYTLCLVSFVSIVSLVSLVSFVSLLSFVLFVSFVDRFFVGPKSQQGEQNSYNLRHTNCIGRFV
jgi:hypothetical protein